MQSIPPHSTTQVDARDDIGKESDPDSTTRQALRAIELCLPVPKATLLN
jgi:hypothetical protein